MNYQKAIIGAQDACALGVWMAHFIQADGRIPAMRDARYSTWASRAAQTALAGKSSLQSLSRLALRMEQNGGLGLPPALEYEETERVKGEIQTSLNGRIIAELKKQGLN